MNKIFFATTNKDKIREAENILGIKIEGTGLEIAEIQSLDPIKVAIEKARAYFARLKKPILVEDVSLSFDALGGLPGTYINDFFGVLGNGGLVNLLKAGKERLAEAVTTLVFFDTKGGEHIFSGKVKGRIAMKPKGKGFGWDPIFIPRGSDKTFGQMRLEEKNKYSMRAKALKKFKKWLEGDFQLRGGKL